MFGEIDINYQFSLIAHIVTKLTEINYAVSTLPVYAVIFRAKPILGKANGNYSMQRHQLKIFVHFF